jgi:hypothetical protein
MIYAVSIAMFLLGLLIGGVGKEENEHREFLYEHRYPQLLVERNNLWYALLNAREEKDCLQRSLREHRYRNYCCHCCEKCLEAKYKEISELFHPSAIDNKTGK